MPTTPTRESAPMGPMSRKTKKVYIHITMWMVIPFLSFILWNPIDVLFKKKSTSNYHFV